MEDEVRAYESSSSGYDDGHCLSPYLPYIDICPFEIPQGFYDGCFFIV